MKKGALYIDIKICDSVSSASHDDFARVYALNKVEEALKDIVLKGSTKRDSTTEAKLKAEEDLEGPELSVRIRETHPPTEDRGKKEKVLQTNGSLVAYAYCLTEPGPKEGIFPQHS